MFVLLTELGRAAADPVVYVRTIGVALLHWQAFHSSPPGLCYGWYGHTPAVTPSDVEDLFVQICPARINRRLLVSGLSSDIETEIRQRLHSFATDNGLRTRYCPW